MHTSAHFPPPTVDSFEHTGTLLHAAEVRTRVLDGDGHTVPVLCFDMELHNSFHTHVHVEQMFGVGQYAQAQAEAQRLKKHTVVTIQAPLVGLRWVATNTTHIYPHAAPAAHPTETTTPCPQTSLLFS